MRTARIIYGTRVVNGMKAVCFDLDGTICDLWEGEHTARLRLIDIITEATDHPRDQIAEVYDFEWAKIKAEYMNHVAEGLDEVDLRLKHISMLQDILQMEEDPRKLAEMHCEITMDGIHVYSDVISVLESISENHRVSMITNGPSHWQREKIKKIGIETYFEEIIVSGELGHHKPSPAIFNEMTRRMDVKPSEIIYIGNDYNKDIVGANDAGWSTAWVNRLDEEAGEVDPTYTIKNLSDLQL